MIFKRSNLLEGLSSLIKEKHLSKSSGVAYENAYFDSRDCTPGSIFVAINGSNSKGAIYVLGAVQNGSTCVIANVEDRRSIQNALEGYLELVDLFFVEDSLAAFGKLGAISRTQYTRDVVGVVGSVGKTSTKDMLLEIGGGPEKIDASKGSFNNETGVPLTLCNLNLKSNRAIIELGESHFGDLDYVTRIAEPTHLIVTNVELAHIQFLGNLDGVARTMNEAVCLMSENSTVIIPALTNKIDLVLKDVKAKVIMVLEGETYIPEVDLSNIVFAKIISKTQLQDLTYDFQLEFEGKTIDAHVPLIGEHFVMNAALAIIASVISGEDINQIVENLQNVVPQGSRMKAIETSFLSIIDDCYNANPASMKASMQAVQGRALSQNKRSVFVMGPMRELGDTSDELHEEMGMFANEIGIELLICIGDETKSASVPPIHSNCYYFLTVSEAIDNFNSLIQKGDLVGVKASRGPDSTMPALKPIVLALEQLK